ncbi:DUF6701 domain-containing protein [Massilia sp. BSC265]|uniref:DUF6701 domain-containing protein n=1 Tax=Massilia sp. BSC265 TaxID=1549812 RepID=UPI0004E947E4|nr:DUF6701 domain-containing protein [Massilia sp. BSC265]KFI05439.1 hypothetical protein JN27_23710 [Massilia sp. BSC265]
MYIPFLFALLFAGQSPLRHQAWRRWLPALALVLAGLPGSGAAQAAVFHFDGRQVGGCTLSDKEYSCPSASAINGNDEVIIASGYTLKVNNSFAFGWNQSLVMRAGSRLVFTGSFSLADMNPDKLDVTGGSIAVGGTFYMGSSAQSMTADVSANAIQLGSARVTINGNLTAQGTLAISSGSKITGNVSGASITASPSTTITGNVIASSKFTLGSGSTVSGSVTAPMFDMLASNSTVNGNITAATSFTMGSGNTVNGNVSTGVFDMQASGSRIKGSVTAATRISMGSGNTVDGSVDTGDLLLQSSNALITGNASVNWATLESAGRIAGTIFCKKGTTAGKCDCVTNNSGFPVNTANGPRCEGPAASQGLRRFLITHDGEGDTCLSEKITVTACANATCTAPHFAGTVSARLLGQDFTIAANAGSAVIDFIRIAAGSVELDVTGATVTPENARECYRTSNNTNSCTMNFTGGTKLKLSVPPHAADAAGVMATLEAVRANDDNSACIAAFQNQSPSVSYACSYGKPKTGTLAPVLGGAALACTPGTTNKITTAFNNNGSAQVSYRYADAGEIRLSAVIDDPRGKASGEGSAVTAPASFLIEPVAGPIRAGAAFALKLTARNLAGATTRNFDTQALNDALATGHAVSLGVECHAQGGNRRSLTAAAPVFSAGVASVAATWPDVGNIDLNASLSGFLGTSLGASGSTNTAGAGNCSGSVGRFIPAYFEVALAAPRSIYYAGEPFPLRVSAMNKAGAVTANYSALRGLSEPLALAANDKTGTAFAAPPGGLSTVTVGADKFSDGVALLELSYVFTPAPRAPAQIRLRAGNGKPAPLDVSSATPAAAEDSAMPIIRSGRLRIGNRFGGLKSTLSVPVTAEYWTGKSWLLHSDDNATLIPRDAFGFKPASAGMTVERAIPGSGLKLVNGAAAFDLRVTAGGSGPVDIAANLGNGKQDNACIGNQAGTGKESAGAGMAWLRSITTGCGTSEPRDPNGRATFGVYTPENRRIIHVREVFN